MSDSVIIIPTYNEIENIDKMTRKIMSLEKDFHVLYVDDSSPDGTADEIRKLQIEFPNSSRFIRPLSGSSEFIRGLERWCLWIEDNELEIAYSIPFIKERIESVRIFRENGGKCVN